MEFLAEMRRQALIASKASVRANSLAQDCADYGPALALANFSAAQAKARGKGSGKVPDKGKDKDAPSMGKSKEADKGKGKSMYPLTPKAAPVPKNTAQK